MGPSPHNITCARSGTYLARIKSTLYGDIAYIGVCDGRHLCLLHRRDATLGVQDEYGQILFSSQAIDSRAVLSRP